MKTKKISARIIFVAALCIISAAIFFLYPRVASASTLSGSVSLGTDNFDIVASGNKINFYSGNYSGGGSPVGTITISGTMTISGRASSPTDNFGFVGTGNTITSYFANYWASTGGSFTVSGGTVSGKVECSTDAWTATGVGNQLVISCNGPGGTITFDDLDLADLTVPSLNWTGSMTPGSSVNFSGSIANWGTADTGTFYARFCIDNPYCYDYFGTAGRVGSDVLIGGLAEGNPNTSVGVSSSANWTVTSGPHQIYLCADVTRWVKESNESYSSNCLFKTLPLVLTVSKVGTGTGTITSSPSGIDCGSDCSEEYLPPIFVTLKAAPDANSTFTGWSVAGMPGTCPGTGDCVLAMNSNWSVTATFTKSNQTLDVTINTSGGTGTVTSSPAGIDCGADCSESYNSGTLVTLTATLDANSTFAGWSANCTPVSGFPNKCTVTMDAQKTVAATFTAANQAPIAVAQISKDGLTYANSITVTQGVATPVYLSAAGSSDPNGWTDATNGVSTDPGKCEWNSDLNQGSPTYENTVAHPASASGCNISLGFKTFNDAPGTYTYQVLRIMDKPGAVSNVATAQVIVQTAPANSAPIAVAQISKDGLTYANSITVTQGVATPVYLSAAGSSDPNGWTDATNGVSTDPGKCEWNSDLNQGSPTYENTVAHPASASGCNISLGSKTFNDAPGTYTYQVLRIMDKPGAVSNVATAQVTVVAPVVPTYLLTVSKAGTGGGTVTPSTGTLTWSGNTGTASYNSGAAVILTATADSGSTFISWSGCDSVNGQDCSVKMDAAKSVTATFTKDNQPPTAALDIQNYSGTSVSSANINASVYLNVGGSSDPDDSITNVKFCSDDTPADSTCDNAWTKEYIWITSDAVDGWDAVTKKKTWSFPTSGNKGVYVQVKDSFNVWSTIVKDTIDIPVYALSVSKAGTGSGTVTSNPAGISCGADCSESYGAGMAVVLTATPDTGSTFTNWSGACSGSGACSVKMDAAKSVTATFGKKEFTLTASPSSQKIAQTDSTGKTYTAAIASVNSFNSAVSLSVSGCPTGATCTLSPTSVTPAANGSSNATLTVKTVNTAVGAYTLTLTGISGSITKTTTVILNVIDIIGTLSASPSSGTAPLTATLTAQVTGGSAVSTVNYKFDCANDGTIDSPNNATYIGTADLTKTFNCNYSSTGNYTASVTIERDVANSIKPTTAITVASAGGCVSSPSQSLVAGDNTIDFQTPHNYTNNFGCYSNTYTCPSGYNAKAYVKYITEANRDYFYIYNTVNNSYSRWSGSNNVFSWKEKSNVANQIKFRFTSNNSVVKWGVDVDKINCYSTAPANSAPIAVAQISKDGLTYANSITVTQGVATPVYLSAAGSSDPNGWTDATNGVSTDPGKCEWNSDLNQGSPTYENTVAHPASASGCNISLGFKTFNDAPGTYTYQILRITDKPGAVSNVATAQVTVAAPVVPTYLLTVSKAGTGGGTVTPSTGTLTWSGNTGTASYNSGAAVILTATADSGSTFISWSGCDSVNGQDCSVKMDAVKTVTAKFNLISYAPSIAPTNLTATAGCDGTNDANVSLTWTDNAANEDGYYVYRSTTNGFTASDSDKIATLSANSTSYTNSDPSISTTYYYKVRVYRARVSIDSNQASVTTGSCPAINPPNFLLNNSKNINASLVKGQAGQSNTTNLTVVPINGFSSNVDLSVLLVSPSLPSGTTYYFSDSNLTSSEYLVGNGSQFKVNIGSGLTSGGTYTIRIQGIDGGLLNTVDVLLNVQIKQPGWTEF